MDLRISNKTALVTGGASGIGKAIVKELLINNVNVFFTSRSQEKIDNVIKEFRKLIRSQFIFQINKFNKIYFINEFLFKDLTIKTFLP